MEGRKEKRDVARGQVLLSSLAQPLLSEQASTENITSYGMCVQTARPWDLGTIVLLKGPKGGALARARVVYCRAVDRKTFTLGLEFLGCNAAWSTG